VGQGQGLGRPGFRQERNLGRYRELQQRQVIFGVECEARLGNEGGLFHVCAVRFIAARGV
jgi:hypothetical protein